MFVLNKLGDGKRCHCIPALGHQKLILEFLIVNEIYNKIDKTFEPWKNFYLEVCPVSVDRDTVHIVFHNISFLRPQTLDEESLVQVQEVKICLDLNHLITRQLSKQPVYAVLNLNKNLPVARNAIYLTPDGILKGTVLGLDSPNHILVKRRVLHNVNLEHVADIVEHAMLGNISVCGVRSLADCIVDHRRNIIGNVIIPSILLKLFGELRVFLGNVGGTLFFLGSNLQQLGNLGVGFPYLLYNLIVSEDVVPRHRIVVTLRICPMPKGLNGIRYLLVLVLVYTGCCLTGIYT
ncbi:hypothetical protein FR483_n666L [Paramecium bursaria Chlorella virus FR483]|uniref:Uncharacterized protein n666L n=1 Tax=Paramecium bursaria Chlorella virus FR483 TaxID=399781 RepID=A7J820_PBCVF|nr:hypothetical protein FR483_n666L [Paramecium bursaria Chlorella virus FR483]ABT15951.1 hypothetical protein FR483_n666L [Paramecium bursaria Chlorella virus FR483]